MIQTIQKILEYTNNLHTKVEIKEDFKGNYYNYVTDTIYISKNMPQQKHGKKSNEISKRTSELVMLCHECIHSSQSKMEHIFNFLLSNISIMIALIYFILELLEIVFPWAKYVLLVLLGLSVVIRIKLELQAINKSTVLAKEAVIEGLADGVSLKEIEASEEYIKKHKALAVMGMVADKILIMAVVIII